MRACQNKSKQRYGPSFQCQNSLKHIGKKLHSPACSFLYVGDILVHPSHYLIWVNEIDWNTGLGILHESSRRIDVETGTDDNEYVSTLSLYGSRLNHRHALAKKYYERTQQTAVASLGSWCHLPLIGRQVYDVTLVIRVVA